MANTYGSDKGNSAANPSSKTTPEMWEKRYNTASGNQAKMFKRFGNWYDALYAVVGVTPSPWRSKMYVPVLARQTWTLVAKFLSLKPGFQVTLNNPDPNDGPTEDIDQKAEKARRKLEYDYENPYMSESMRDKLYAPLVDALVTGTGVAKVLWRREDVDRYERIPQKDGTIDLTKEKKTTKKIAYNDIEPVNIFNVFISPAAHNLYDSPWVVIKEFKTIDELKDINEDAGVAIYKNLDKLEGTTSFDDDMNSFNRARNRLMNQTDRVDNTVKMVKIYECYEGDTICTYAESQSSGNDASWLLIREQTNPYWHGKYPLVRFTVRNKPFQFWGEGIFEVNYRSQAAYNDVFNHFMDQWNLSENSMLIVPERANVNDYVVEPGGVITYRGDIAPQQFKHESPNPQQLQTILTYLDQAIEGTTISQYAAGNPNSNADNTKGTATGIEHLQKAAGDTVSFMRLNFTQSLTQIGRMWLSNNQQFMQEPITIMVTNKGQRAPMQITPQDMQGDMQLLIDDTTMDPANEDERIAKFLIYFQQLQQIQTASVQQSQETRWATTPIYLDFNAVLQNYSEIMNNTQYDKLLLDKNTVMQAMQNAQTPWFMPHERFSIDLNELYGSEAAQYLQRNGIQPDPNRQQQTPVVGGNATQADAKGIDGGQPNITPEMLLNADQQQHQQTMDKARLGLDAAKMQHEQAMAQNQAQQQAQQAQQAQQPQPSPMNPEADQATYNLAQQLAGQGHIDPSILQQLSQPQLPAKTDKKKAKSLFGSRK